MGGWSVHVPLYVCVCVCVEVCLCHCSRSSLLPTAVWTPMLPIPMASPKPLGEHVWHTKQTLLPYLLSKDAPWSCIIRHHTHSCENGGISSLVRVVSSKTAAMLSYLLVLHLTQWDWEKYVIVLSSGKPIRESIKDTVKQCLGIQTGLIIDKCIGVIFMTLQRD